jgi:hypothetical protein
MIHPTTLHLVVVSSHWPHTALLLALDAERPELSGAVYRIRLQ